METYITDSNFEPKMSRKLINSNGNRIPKFNLPLLKHGLSFQFIIFRAIIFSFELQAFISIQPTTSTTPQQNMISSILSAVELHGLAGCCLSYLKISVAK